jgi:predicted O-linked N-acetylglucosamine transferase (SPINDLY family)
LEGAAACCRQALALRPDFAEAHNNLGNVFRAQGRLDEALACYRRTLELKPDYAEGHFNLGIALQDQGKLDEAIVCYRRALDLRPNYAEVQNNLGNAFRDQANLDEAIVHYRRALELKPDYSRAHSNLLYTLSFHAGCVAVDILQEGRRWNQRHAEPLAGLIAPHWNDRNPDRRLRVGYISPDFRDHCQAFFTVPLFSAHDHRQFEIFYYADVAAPDHVTARLQTDADRWRNIVRLDPQQVAQRIRQDQIDILVDLTMHMAGSHLLVFARRPAPVQVCWLAYPGTTGLSAIDYRLTDVHLDPPGLNDRYYTEESIRLPDSFWCYDPLRREPAVSPLPASDKRCVTFGCLNNFCKINAAVLKLWAQVLRSVGQSRLMLLAAEGSARRHTQDLLEQEGVAPDRVVFVSRRPRSEYLQLYQHIDIGLDTFPYNGHTTSLDSFWMGVPVVTLVGQTVAGRGGLCQLMNLGLPELVAETPEQFVQVAVQLAGDLPRLRELRAGLRDRLERSPLMDAPRFARNVETAYRRMWRRWCAEGRSENRSEPAPDTGSTHNFREGPS